MTSTTIVYERLGGVARITLNRPERANALNQTMLAEICLALDDAERDPQIRALIVHGAGAAFSSGFDLKEQMERRPTGVAEWEPILRRDFETVMRFWHSRKPTIAAVRGPCLAGGFELALACDLTIAADDAFFGEPELKFGAGIVVMLLPWLVGPKIAKEIILLGEDRLSAARAQAIGIVNRVVPTAELEATALAIARGSRRTSWGSRACDGRAQTRCRAQCRRAAPVGGRADRALQAPRWDPRLWRPAPRTDRQGRSRRPGAHDRGGPKGGRT